MHARQRLEMRFECIKETLLIFEEQFENRISLVKDTYNSNQKNAFQRLDTIHHELKSEIQTFKQGLMKCLRVSRRSWTNQDPSSD